VYLGENVIVLYFETVIVDWNEFVMTQIQSN
jgi:hypothetical protein